jgi:hypothetical protein
MGDGSYTRKSEYSLAGGGCLSQRHTEPLRVKSKCRQGNAKAQQPLVKGVLALVVGQERGLDFARCASFFLGAFPPVEIRDVCLVRAIHNICVVVRTTQKIVFCV